MTFIDMMNYFVFREITPKMFFNYKSVFRNISLFIFKRMFGRFNFYISLTGNSFSTLPMIMFIARIISSQTFIPRSKTFLKFRHKSKVSNYKLSITNRLELSNLYR